MGAITTAALGIAQAGGQIAQGFQAGKAEQFNAAVSRANAQAIRQSADLDIARQKKAAVRFKSGQIAGYAKAGVKLEGSPLEVMLDSAAEAELDMMITDYNARVGIAQQEAQASQYERSAKLAMRKGIMSGIGTLLNTGVGMYGGKAMAPKGGGDSGFFRETNRLTKTGQISTSGKGLSSRFNTLQTVSLRGGR